MASKGPRAETEVDPDKAALAERLARDLVDCDSSILSFIFVDDYGRVVHVARSARLDKMDYVSPELLPIFGAVAKTIIGAANNAAQVMGRTEAIVGIFKNQKILLVNLQEYGLVLALRLARSANAEYVSDKIADLLAARGEA